MSQDTGDSNLHALLRFCLEATKAEDSTSGPSFGAIDPEKRQFLENVLSAIVADPVDELKKAMTLVSESLEHVPANADPDSDIVKQVVKVVDETILDIIADLDYANDFYKLDGLSLIQKFLSSSVPILNAKGCELVAETVQNNPKAQEVILNSGLLKYLCETLDHSANEAVQIKSLYAISCIIRDNEAAAVKFDTEFDGLSVLIRTLQKDPISIKLRTKVCFLIASLCVSEEKIRESFFKMGLVEQLIALLHQDHNPSQEHIASALFAMVSNHDGAKSECLRQDLGLEQLLKSRISDLKGREEYFEEIANYKELLELCFPVGEEESDR